MLHLNYIYYVIRCTQKSNSISFDSNSFLIFQSTRNQLSLCFIHSSLLHHPFTLSPFTRSDSFHLRFDVNFKAILFSPFHLSPKNIHFPLPFAHFHLHFPLSLSIPTCALSLLIVPRDGGS